MGHDPAPELRLGPVGEAHAFGAERLVGPPQVLDGQRGAHEPADEIRGFAVAGFQRLD